MFAPQTLVIHVAAADADASEISTLRHMRARPEPHCTERLVVVGRGGLDVSGLWNAVHVRVPLGARALRARALWTVLDGMHRRWWSSDPTRQRALRYVVHAWTPRALAWCADNRPPSAMLVARVRAGSNLPKTAARFCEVLTSESLILACPSSATRRRLESYGVPASACPIVRDPIQVSTLDHIDRQIVRSRLGLRDAEPAVLIVPPVTRESGAFMGAWAALLASEARHDLRVVIPPGAEELLRVRRLIRQSRHEHVVRYATSYMTPAELAVAADVAVFVPPRGASATGLSWALAAGRPIVSSTVPDACEVLQGCRAWFCSPADPRDAARAILEALAEPPDDAARNHASARAVDLFDVEKILTSYRRRYTMATRAGGPLLVKR